MPGPQKEQAPSAVPPVVPCTQIAVRWDDHADEKPCLCCPGFTLTVSFFQVWRRKEQKPSSMTVSKGFLRLGNLKLFYLALIVSEHFSWPLKAFSYPPG